MKQNLQRKLHKYKVSISQQSLDTAKVKKLGLTSAAAMAAVVTIPVELNSQVVCGNQGTPTRTIGSCIGGSGNLGAFYTNFCAKFDFDGDGINELQVRYYNYWGVYPNAYAYIDPIGVNIHTVLLGSAYFGYPTFPQTPTLQTWNYSAQYRDKLYLVPLSTGSGYGFIAFDMDATPWLPDGSGVHPNTGQPICCYDSGLPSMWGGHSGITIADFNVTSADMTDCGNASAVLPVEFSKFEATAKENAVLLEWTTETEINNAGFAIERSMDGKDFREIAFVDGEGESSSSVDYIYKDIEVKEGETYYYRLRQVDYDGRYDFSEVRAAKLENTSLQITIAPNPAYNFLNININSNLREEVSFNIYSLNGVELSKKTTLQISSGNTMIDISDIPTGVYFLKTTSGPEVHYKKFLVQK